MACIRINTAPRAVSACTMLAASLDDHQFLCDFMLCQLCCSVGITNDAVMPLCCAWINAVMIVLAVALGVGASSPCRLLPVQI